MFHSFCQNWNFCSDNGENIIFYMIFWRLDIKVDYYLDSFFTFLVSMNMEFLDKTGFFFWHSVFGRESFSYLSYRRVIATEIFDEWISILVVRMEMGFVELNYGRDAGICSVENFSPLLLRFPGKYLSQFLGLTTGWKNCREALDQKGRVNYWSGAIFFAHVCLHSW